MQAASTLGWLVMAYLVGAVPFSFLFARIRGVDIRKAGSGNVGATNVFRTVGRGWGAAALAADVLKGFAPAWGIPRLAGMIGSSPAGPPAGLGLLCGAAAVAGHTWPVYLRFRGGKGVATSAGVLLGIAPAAVGVGAAAWAAVFLLSGFVSLASIGAALAVALAAWPLYAADAWLLPSALTLLGLLVVVRHRSNIDRLRAGTERRVSFRRTERIAR